MENQLENYEVIPNINYSVYNALNLACEDLGQQYIETGFNPFGNSFELTEDYIADALANGKNAPEIKSPDFIEKGDKATLQAFANSLTNCESLLAELEGKANSAELSPEQKAKLQKVVTYLKMRIELLKMYIEKFKSKKNKLKLYQNLLALNYAYGEMLEDSYQEAFDAHALANQLLFIQQNQTKTTPARDEALIAKAKQIIANNLKNQELANEQAQEIKQATTSQTTQPNNPYIDALKEINAQKQAQAPTQESPRQEQQTTKPNTSQTKNNSDGIER
ncbi:MAG: hypothetical protein IJ318_03330 [Clostridia bacterium]|nr:hypothetical protein [Clostridia bacterium]